MHLDEHLNLVLPLYRDDAEDSDPYAWVYSTPIAADMFDRYFKVLSLTMSELPRIGGSIRAAVNCLKDAAQQLAGKEADRMVEPLLAEIKRLSEVALATPAGWDRMPLDDAERAGHITDGDMREVMSSIVFFSAAWHTFARRTRREFLEAAFSRLQIIASEPSVFFAGLPPLMKAVTGSPAQPVQTTAGPAVAAVAPPAPLAL